jgi:hypothetical protein
MDSQVPTAPQVFQMATENGADTTRFAAEIGTWSRARRRTWC